MLVVAREPVTEKTPMLLRVEIVTPHSGPRFLKRVELQDPKLDHLALELVHWGFGEVMAWVYKLHSIIRQNPNQVPPTVSVHGFPEDVTWDMVQAFETVGVLWMPRSEKKNLGKDCATIIREMVASQGVVKQYPPNKYDDTTPKSDYEEPKPPYYFDPDEYREDLMRYATHVDDSNFQEVVFNRPIHSEGEVDCGNEFTQTEFEQLLRETLKSSGDL